jgi:hypothetical protein
MKYVKWLLIVLLAGAGLVFLTVIFLNEPLPEGKSGSEANQVANKMLETIGKSSYDSIRQISWSFPGDHHYVWDKKNNIVTVRWADYKVKFSPETMEGTVRKGSDSVEGQEKTEMIKKAWSFYANDSFWLLAPFKIKDPGTTLSLVDVEEGTGLLVNYSIGGVTPGDSYLWILDENFRPVSWKMWVKIIPIGGVEFSWEGWSSYEGVYLSTVHQGPFSLKIQLDNVEVQQ